MNAPFAGKRFPPSERRRRDRQRRCERREHFSFIANTAPGHFASISIQPSYRGLCTSVWAPTCWRTKEQIEVEESLQRCVEAVLRFAKRDCAEFVLNAATAAGFSIGTDGAELIVVSPRDLPEETKKLFYRAFSEHQAEMIELIRRENAA